jgi:hypothetical protein
MRRAGAGQAANPLGRPLLGKVGIGDPALFIDLKDVREDREHYSNVEPNCISAGQ